MESFNNIAVLVDSDNAMIGSMESIINKILTFGRITVRRIYGNWKKDNLKNWETVIKELAFNAQQQFDYVKKKNATDIALVIDAMKLLYTERYDAFVIVSSDSDYTPLSIALKETGVYVIGFGKESASDAFKRSCDDFYDVNKISKDSVNVISTTENNVTTYENEQYSDEERDLHAWLKIAAETEAWQMDDGFVNISSAGTYIKRLRPDFDIRHFGFDKLPDFVEAHSKIYETKIFQGKGKAKIRAYKLRTRSI